MSTKLQLLTAAQVQRKMAPEVRKAFVRIVNLRKSLHLKMLAAGEISETMFQHFQSVKFSSLDFEQIDETYTLDHEGCPVAHPESSQWYAGMLSWENGRFVDDNDECVESLLAE